MAKSRSIALLALLLALKQLETPLTADERANLETIGEQLALDPDDWDYIQEGLMAVIQQNPELDRLFQTAKVQLEAIDGNIPIELLPTQQEKETELLPQCRETVTFGYTEGEPDKTSNEFVDVSINVLTQKDPSTTTKNLSFLQRILDYFQKSKS
ncbi:MULTISPECIES: hypothetical protein [unclassified Microcoleus]|uniref:hypothetical protein n=1 Tax=unclassified Microcoleus TaxID=2642155 RepID=UPI0025D3D18E|nr:MULTISPECIES: hypothetical protein [unclassified Microcoleus]